MSPKILLQIELVKLFRRSNVLFFFLFLYLFVTPVGRGIDMLKREELPVSSDVFMIIVGAFAIFGMLAMALFMVNNTGNDFNENSYRKGIANGLSKAGYFSGKLIFMLIISGLILFFTFLVYFIFGFFSGNFSLHEMVRGVSLLSVFHQLVALLYAGSWGLFMIMVFRNRTIGLVFFPFWMFTEIIVYVFSKAGYLWSLHGFFPGIAGYQLYTQPDFNLLQLGVVIIWGTVFITAAWYGLELREEKPA